jgi:putative ABC transport system substrate-binding protein
MKLRTFYIALALALGILWPLASSAETRVYRIAYISRGSPDSHGAFVEAFREGLRQFGYLEGRNLVIDYQWGDQTDKSLEEMATDAVKNKPDVLLTTCVPSTRAAKQASTTIPIVMAIDGDPMRSELVASFAQPSGNATGLYSLYEELIPKMLELLHTAFPRTRLVAVLTDPDNPADAFFWGKFETTAQALGSELLRVEASAPGELEGAFAQMKKEGAHAFLVAPSELFLAQRERIVNLAGNSRLPAIYGFREYAEAGGLMSYGISFRDQFARAAGYVDKIFKGAKSSQLPVEQGSKVELVVNAKTAKTLGITLPQAVLLRADRVIE